MAQRARLKRAGGHACAVVDTRDRSTEATPAPSAVAAVQADVALLVTASSEAAQAVREVAGSDNCVDACRAETEAGLHTPPRRRVRFSEAPDVVLEVTPYCEIYGIHPRYFVFDRHYYMVPAGGPYGFVDVPAAAEVDKRLDVEEGAAGDSEWEDSDDEGEWEPPVLIHYC